MRGGSLFVDEFGEVVSLAILSGDLHFYSHGAARSAIEDRRSDAGLLNGAGTDGGLRVRFLDGDFLLHGEILDGGRLLVPELYAMTRC